MDEGCAKEKEETCHTVIETIQCDVVNINEWLDALLGARPEEACEKANASGRIQSLEFLLRDLRGDIRDINNRVHELQSRLG